MAKDLTLIQRQTFNILKTHRDMNIELPTYRKLAKHFNVTVGAIMQRLIVLERKGYIKLPGGKGNSIQLLK